MCLHHIVGMSSNILKGLYASYLICHDVPAHFVNAIYSLHQEERKSAWDPTASEEAGPASLLHAVGRLQAYRVLQPDSTGQRTSFLAPDNVAAASDLPPTVLPCTWCFLLIWLHAPKRESIVVTMLCRQRQVQHCNETSACLDAGRRGFTR
jgi:hypothetical protein